MEETVLSFSCLTWFNEAPHIRRFFWCICILVAIKGGNLKESSCLKLGFQHCEPLMLVYGVFLLRSSPAYIFGIRVLTSTISSALVWLVQYSTSACFLYALTTNWFRFKIAGPMIRSILVAFDLLYISICSYPLHIGACFY